MPSHKVIPVISTTALTCVTTAGSPTVTSAALFGSVTGGHLPTHLKGMRVVGAGIPFGTRVLSVESTSSLTLDQPASATSAAVSLRFGYFTSAAYTAGDALGFPFEVDIRTIRQITVHDKAKQIAAMKFYFFSAPFTEVADNAAWDISDADGPKLLNYVSIATQVVLGSGHVVTQGPTALPIALSGEKVYCQLVTPDTPTFATVEDLTIVFEGE